MKVKDFAHDVIDGLFFLVTSVTPIRQLSSEDRHRICHTYEEHQTESPRLRNYRPMEVITPKTTRRSTRLRVEIPITVTSLDRMHPFAERCTAVVVSCQGCGFCSSRPLPLETPILIGDLPGGGSISARIASCVPLGKGGKEFLIGAALYNHGNVWGITNPPADWDAASVTTARRPASNSAEPPATATQKQAWPYNLAIEGAELHLSKK